MRPARKVDNLPPSCAVVTKSGYLNFLKPFGPAQLCNGTDLPFSTVGIQLHCVQLHVSALYVGYLQVVI